MQLFYSVDKSEKTCCMTSTEAVLHLRPTILSSIRGTIVNTQCLITCNSFYNPNPAAVIHSFLFTKLQIIM